MDNNYWFNTDYFKIKVNSNYLGLKILYDLH